MRADDTVAPELLLQEQEKLGIPLVGGVSGVVPGTGADIPALTLWGDVWRRLRRNKLAIIGSAIIIVLIMVAILAPLIAPFPYDKQNLDISQNSPSLKHWFGTDLLGRDYFSRVIYGARVSVIIGLLTLAIILAIAVPLGAAAGYFGGWIDAVVMRVADVIFAYPFIVGAIVVITVLGENFPRIYALAIAIGIFSWATVARVFRSSILQIKNSEYVEAARAAGAGHWRILSRHIVPNAIAPVIVLSTLNVGFVILTEAGLSFLGIGVQVGVPTWGLLVSQGKSFLSTEPWLVFFPGTAIALTVLGFIFLGDGLRDSMDPRLR